MSTRWSFGICGSCNTQLSSSCVRLLSSVDLWTGRTNHLVSLSPEFLCVLSGLGDGPGGKWASYLPSICNGKTVKGNGKSWSDELWIFWCIIVIGSNQNWGPGYPCTHVHVPMCVGPSLTSWKDEEGTLLKGKWGTLGWVSEHSKTGMD